MEGGECLKKSKFLRFRVQSIKNQSLESIRIARFEFITPRNFRYSKTNGGKNGKGKKGSR